MGLLRAFKTTLEKVEKLIVTRMLSMMCITNPFSETEELSPSPSKKARTGEATKKLKKSRSIKPALIQEWKTFGVHVSKFEVQQEQVKNSFAFSFVEGALVKAIKKVQ